jgi:hypothetical protein
MNNCYVGYIQKYFRMIDKRSNKIDFEASLIYKSDNPKEHEDYE